MAMKWADLNSEQNLNAFLNLPRKEQLKGLREMRPESAKWAPTDQLNFLDAMTSTYHAQFGKPMADNVRNEPGLQDSTLSLPTETLNAAGEATAEKIGATGHPTLGAALGTAVQMAPDIAMAGSAVFKGIPALQETGLLSSRSEIGNRIAALKASAGIAPEAVSAIGKPEEQAQFVNDMTRLLQSNYKNTLTPPQIEEARKQLGLIVENEPSWVARHVMGAKSDLDPSTLALASKARAGLTDQLEGLIPGLEQAHGQYGSTIARDRFLKALASAAVAKVVGGKAIKLGKAALGKGE